MRVGPEYANALHPHFELHSTPLMLPPQGRAVQDVYVGDSATPAPRVPVTTQRNRKTHIELHASVFRSLGKRPARKSKTHVQLHTEVFQDGIVWTPSGFVQDIDILSLTGKKPGDVPVRELPRRPPQDNSTRYPSRSGSGTNTTHSPDKVVFPLAQPPPLPPISPLRVRSPGVSSQLSLAVSESPMPRVSLPSITHTHKRTVSSRLTRAVKAMMPGLQSRNSDVPPESPPPDDNKERVKDPQSPTKFLSLIDRRPIVVPSRPRANTSEFLTRAPPSSQRKESLVLQRARAYEQTAGASLRESDL